MFKFILTAGLVLGSLVGGAYTGFAAQTDGSIQLAAGVEYEDFGPFTYLVDAIEERDGWRQDGFAANVITGRDGNYWVRVFGK